jgi:hypothetical protein
LPKVYTDFLPQPTNDNTNIKENNIVELRFILF